MTMHKVIQITEIWGQDVLQINGWSNWWLCIFYEEWNADINNPQMNDDQ